MEPKRTIAGYIFPKLGDIIFISIFMGVILLGPRTLNVDGDLGRHITIGNYILTSRTIPTTDIFSHTLSGEKLTPHEWLAQVLFSLSHQAMGLNGIVLLEAIVIAATFLIVFRDTLKLSGSYLIAGGLTFWAAAASSLHWVARPHILTFLFLALWAPIIRTIPDKPRRAYLIAPILMFFWANSHGAFIAGFVVLACFIAGWFFDYLIQEEKPSRKALRDFSLVGILSFLMSLINPAGMTLWSTSLGYIQNDYLVSHTQEYLSPDFHNPGFLPFLAFIAFLVFILSKGYRKLPSAFSLLIAGWLTMALYSARNIPLFIIIASPIVGYYLYLSISPEQLIGKMDLSIRRTETQLRGFFLPLVCIILVGVLFISGGRLDILRLGNHFSHEVFPVDAVDWLEDNPQTGNMFNYFTWGGYLLYRLWPDQTVFIDGQTDFYGEELTREYSTVNSSDSGWEEILEKYDVDWVIIPVNSSLSGKLIKMPEWSLRYQDDVAAIFNR